MSHLFLDSCGAVVLKDSFVRRGKRQNGKDTIGEGREAGHQGVGGGHNRREVGHLGAGREGTKGRCHSCDNIRVKPKKQFIDCIVD